MKTKKTMSKKLKGNINAGNAVRAFMEKGIKAQKAVDAVLKENEMTIHEKALFKAAKKIELDSDHKFIGITREPEKKGKFKPSLKMCLEDGFEMIFDAQTKIKDEEIVNLLDVLAGVFCEIEKRLVEKGELIKGEIYE
jgi:hypothetical protein